MRTLHYTKPRGPVVSPCIIFFPGWKPLFQTRFSQKHYPAIDTESRFVVKISGYIERQILGQHRVRLSGKSSLKELITRSVIIYLLLILR